MARSNRSRDEEVIRHLTETEKVNMEDAYEIEDSDDEELLNELSNSMIVRVLNVHSVPTKEVITDLPRILNLEGKMKGRAIAKDRVQFTFTDVAMLEDTLQKSPWYFNGWLVTGERWTPDPKTEQLNFVWLWVQIKGIPLDRIKKSVVKQVGKRIGTVDESPEGIVLHAKNSDSLEHVRARILLPISEPLVFKLPFKFPKGDPVEIEFAYEKLMKLCHYCKRLTHDLYRCEERRKTLNTSHDSVPQDRGYVRTDTYQSVDESAPRRTNTVSGRGRGRGTKPTQRAPVGNVVRQNSTSNTVSMRLGPSNKPVQEWKVKDTTQHMDMDKAITRNHNQPKNIDAAMYDTPRSLSFGERLQRVELQPGDFLLKSGKKVQSPDLAPGEKILKSGIRVSPSQARQSSEHHDPPDFSFQASDAIGKRPTRKRRPGAKQYEARKRAKQQRASESNEYHNEEFTDVALDPVTPVHTRLSNAARFAVSQKPHRSI